MKFENLNGEQKQAIEEIKDLIEDIAWENRNFVCDECLYTMNKLFSILTLLTGDVNQKFYDEIQEISHFR